MSAFLWLASYPKSGNTWLRLALASLWRKGTSVDITAGSDFGAIVSDRTAFEQVLDVDSADLTAAEIERLRPRFLEMEARRIVEPQVRKVHDAWTLTASGEPLFPASLTQAAIYIVRDPRDVAVSFAHHLGLDLDRTIAFMGRSNARLGGIHPHGASQLGQRLSTWSEHVRSWREAPLQLLTLRYEDMLVDPGAALASAARHFGWEPAADDIDRAVAATHFDVLQAAEERAGFPERSLAAERFFRVGVAGGWRHALTRDQVNRIEADHGNVMSELGYR